MKILNSLNSKVIAFSSLLFVSVSSFADGQGPDLTPLTSQVHFDSVVSAICAIFGAGVAVSLAWVGGSKVLSAIKRM
ncbi:hypothetical protein OX373_002306 [Salmonella enterica]|nr:hypothetical protein [Salmonella enterica]